jgi:drug/metabolite transporter (DMT)-like permease
MSIVLALASALLYGIADFSGGWGSSKSHVLSVLVVSQLAGISLALVALALDWPGWPSPPDLLWGFLAGVSGSLGLFALYRGIATSIVAVISPASALVGALLPLGFGMAMGERPSELALVGAALCLPAVLLLSSGKGGGDAKALRSALVQGCLAGLGFGGFFIAISRTHAASGLWPLVASRSVSVVVALVALALTRRKLELRRGGRAVTLAAGLADMGANIAFLVATRTGMLAIVSVVSSLYPAPTVILGRLVFKERIPPRRVAGLVMALAGVVLISLN